MKKANLNAVDLGALQGEFVNASRDAKAKSKAYGLAEAANDNAKARLSAIKEKLSSASRAVLADS